jgi:hypothetical protein
VTNQRHRGRLARWLPLVPLAAGGLWFVLLARDANDVDAPVEVRSDAPLYTSLGALVGATDLIVVAEATDEAPGRVISAGADPDAAFGTRLVTLDVIEALRGQTDGTLIMEELATTADGTAVVVDGQPATQVGERLLLFLVHGDAGTDAEAGQDELGPYVAIVNGQGRYVLSPTDQVIGPPSLLPVDWTLDELRRLAAACAAASAC